MKQIIKDILLEFYEEGIPKTLERLVTKPFLPEIVRKVWVLMGMRRTGKTWTAYQHMHEIINKGLEKEKILYLNFEDDRLAGFSLKDFQSILDAYFDLHPEFSNSSDLFFCFDEIHIIEGWEKFIRRLLDKEKMQICVTGSSAHMLSKELSTTLGGRAWAQEIFPCDFREFLAFKKVKASFDVSAKARSELRNLATEYLLYGGFPETILSSKESYVPLVQDYIHAVIFKDIVERYEVKNIHALKTFLLYCLRQLSAPLSVTKIFNTLKSQGVIVGKTLFTNI